MSAETDGCIITFAGMRGSGKTTKLRDLVAESRRLLVGDPEGKYDPGPHDELVIGAAQLRQVIAGRQLLNPYNGFRIVYRDHEAVMRHTCPGVAFALRDCTVLLEELACFCKPSYLPDELDNLIVHGRVRRVNVAGTTREPQEIHDRMFSQADLVYLFHFEPGNGLDRIRRRYKDVAEKLPQLGRFQYELRVQSMGLQEAAVLCKLSSEGHRNLDRKRPPRKAAPARS